MTVGLLRICSTDEDVAPCVRSIKESPVPLHNPEDLGTVTEKILFPPGDPKWR